jgi:methionyl-tRNA synthetase
MKNFYITTPIYYVNDSPHIGHAYTDIAADFVARFKRLDGYKVKFLTGTDEHGQKIERSAQKINKPTQDFVDEVANRFKNLSQMLNLSNDDFIRTSELRHKRAATHLWQELVNRGHIYKGKYSGWYSVRDEAYFEERELIDGKAPTGAEVEWVEEESYFFNLSKWQSKLLDFYRNNPNFIHPTSRLNEVLRFVEGGLEDLSISRSSFKWGIPVPSDESHVMYVWFDALTNYISALGYPDLNSEIKNFWPADIHMVGKDILRFHAVYWPAFLMAADLQLPKQIVAHGWWTVDGAKISKSVGNVIDPQKLVSNYGVDQTRYFLLREIAFGNDGNFSNEAMTNRINAELANNIGNLAQRTLSMIHKNCAGMVPEYDVHKIYEQPLLVLAMKCLSNMRSHIDNSSYQLALEEVVSLATAANIYIDEKAPWSLAKTNLGEMQFVLVSLLEIIRYIAILMQPITPNAAASLLDMIQVEPTRRSFNHLNWDNIIKAGAEIVKPTAVFPRILEVNNEDS